MVTVVEGECTSPENMVVSRKEIIAVTYCIVELRRLTEERRKIDPHWFAALKA